MNWSTKRDIFIFFDQGYLGNITDEEIYRLIEHLIQEEYIDQDWQGYFSTEKFDAMWEVDGKIFDILKQLEAIEK